MSGGGCWTPGPWTKSRAGMTAQAGGRGSVGRRADANTEGSERAHGRGVLGTGYGVLGSWPGTSGPLLISQRGPSLDPASPAETPGLSLLQKAEPGLSKERAKTKQNKTGSMVGVPQPTEAYLTPSPHIHCFLRGRRETPTLPAASSTWEAEVSG